MNEWQPIETAVRKDSGNTIAIDLWAKRWVSEKDDFEFRRFTDCVWMPASNRWGGLDHNWRATHWMPLPEPPK